MSLVVYSSTTATDYRVPTLMHDHVYRMGVAWQNVAYNQPPHLGYYLPDYIASFKGVEPTPTGITNIKTNDTQHTGKTYSLDGTVVVNPTKKGVYIRNGKKLVIK